MLNWKKVIYIPMCIGLASLLTSCGGQAYNNLNQNGMNQGLLPLSPVSPTGDDWWKPGSGDPTPSPSDTPDLPAPIDRSFRLQHKATSSSVCTSPTPSGVSVGSYTVSNINTDNMMKVTLRGSAPTALPCSTATMAYSCISMRVTVGTREKELKVSYGSPAAGPCAGVPNSVTEDFKDQAPRGHGPLSVRVEEPQIDNCRLFYGCAQVQGNLVKNWYNQYYNNYSSCYYAGLTWIAPGAGNQYSGCSPMGVAYDNYIVAGALSIQTNTSQ